MANISQKEIEAMKEKIIILIDENRDPWRKAAFYGDEVVQEIMNRLYDRWEKAGRKDRPIDYATTDELKILVKLAEKYAKASSAEIMRSFMQTGRTKTSDDKKKRGTLKRVLKMLFLWHD